MKTMLRKTTKPLGNNAGFTFVELLIAFFIITLIVAGYAAANTKAQQSSEVMHERTLAIQEANRVIELMRNTSRTGTFPGNVVAAYPSEGSVAGLVGLTDETITVSYADTSANPLDVTVTVAWTSYVGRPETEEVRTYITQR